MATKKLTKSLKTTLYVAGNAKQDYFAVCNKEGYPVRYDYYILFFVDTQEKAEIIAVRRALQAVREYEFENKIIIKEVEILTSEKELLNFKNKKTLSSVLLDYAIEFGFNLKIKYVSPKENFAKKYIKPAPLGFINIDKIITEPIN